MALGCEIKNAVSMTGDAGASEKVGGRRRRLRGLFGLLLLALPLILGACQETTPEDLSAALRELNADRAAYQLAPLRQDPTLNAKADTWAKHLRDTCTLSHSVLTEDLGSLDWNSLGENVGYGPSIPSIQDAFMNSPGHRVSILKAQYEIVGLGVVHGTCSGKERTYIVQVFADLR